MLPRFEKLKLIKLVKLGVTERDDLGVGWRKRSRYLPTKKLLRVLASHEITIEDVDKGNPEIIILRAEKPRWDYRYKQERRLTGKLDLPIELLSQMDVLLKQDPDLFERYAIRDAEIAALHAWAMAEFSVANGLGNAPPITLVFCLCANRGKHYKKGLSTNARRRKSAIRSMASWSRTFGRRVSTTAVLTAPKSFCHHKSHKPF